MEIISNEQYHYEAEATYAEVLPVGENGAMIEVDKTSMVKIRKLQRKNIDHAKLAMEICQATTMQAVAEAAVKFVSVAVEGIGEQKKVKEALKGDMIACFNLYNSKTVQEDVERFLSKLDFVQTAKDEVPAE